MTEITDVVSSVPPLLVVGILIAEVLWLATRVTPVAWFIAVTIAFIA